MYYDTEPEEETSALDDLWHSVQLGHLLASTLFGEAARAIGTHLTAEDEHGWEPPNDDPDEDDRDEENESAPDERDELREGDVFSLRQARSSSEDGEP